MNVRHAVVAPCSPATGARWSPLSVTWRTEAVGHRGWWRHDGRGVIAVVTDPPTDPPARMIPLIAMTPFAHS